MLIYSLRFFLLQIRFIYALKMIITVPRCALQIRALLSHITSDERLDRAMIAHLIAITLNLILRPTQSNPLFIRYFGFLDYAL